MLVLDKWLWLPDALLTLGTKELVMTRGDYAVIHTLVHQTPILVTHHGAVTVVQTPQVSGLILQGIVARRQLNILQCHQHLQQICLHHASQHLYFGMNRP